MAATRKDNDKYYLGVNVLGRPAWMLRDPKTGSSGGMGSSANLLGASNEGTDLYEDLPLLPQPSFELKERLVNRGDWSGLDLSGLDLRDVLAECELYNVSGVNFSGSDFRGTIWSGVGGDHVDFSGARTAGMTMDQGVRLRNVRTDGVFDMTDFTLGYTDIRFVNPTRLIGCQGVSASRHGGYGVSVRVTNVDFSGEEIQNGDLDAFSEITDGNFTDTTFPKKYHSGYAFRGIKFVRCDFTNAAIPDAEVSSAFFERCELRDTDLSGWSFDGYSTFQSCNFENTNMNGWIIDRYAGTCEIAFTGDTSFSDVDLTGADEEVVKEMVRGGYPYGAFSLREAAEQTGIDVDELGVLIWLGDVEVRDNLSGAVVTGRADNSIHLPEWSVNKLK
jgi:uncharacterized protein YjbI with pentapeptide repeats